MAKPGMIVMAVIAASVVLASCNTQPHSLFADRTVAAASNEETGPALHRPRPDHLM